MGVGGTMTVKCNKNFYGKSPVIVKVNTVRAFFVPRENRSLNEQRKGYLNASPITSSVAPDIDSQSNRRL